MSTNEETIDYGRKGLNLKYNINENTFDNCSLTDGLRYIKGMWSTYDKFYNEFISKLPDFNNKMFWKPFEQFKDMYNDVEPFTYKEAFELENLEFQALVFGSVDISEMINNLGKERIKTDGKRVTRKVWDKDGNRLDDIEYDNVYETYEVNGEKIGVNEPMYAVKCWCTSTNQEHWLWIEDEYKDDPLAAIASTFRFAENVIPKIKELKRQGDIILLEMEEEVTPEGQERALTKEEYFGLLTSES